MSSHHFVKEDQEPALLIADADAIPFAVVQQLLEWSPTVVVLEQALENVLSWGIKVDVVIGQSDHVKTLVNALTDQAPIKILSHQPNEEGLPTAILFLIAGKYKAVNVVGCEPAQLDTFAQHLDVVTFDAHKRWAYARTGKFEKWLTKGLQLMFIPTITKPDGLSDDGFVLQDGLVSLQADHPFWVGEHV
jgi:thiamine pyrophosphokinase